MGDIENLGAHRAERADDNRLLTPLECLREAIAEIESGDRSCDGVLVLTLDRSGEYFRVGYYASNMKASEIIATCEIMKTRALKAMGHIPEE